MKIDRQNHDSLNATLVMTIEKADYITKFEDELKKYKNKVSLKGFRKGKTPLSSIKKMYGKGVLAEMINEQIQKNLADYFVDNKVNVLGNPLASEDQEMYDFDLKNLNDFVFKFDIGMSPDFEVKGLDGDKTYDDYNVVVPEKMLNDELEGRQKRLGETIHPEDGIKEDDIIVINAKEQEGDAAKKKGWETEFSILVNRIGNEDLLKSVLKLKQGDSFKFDIYDIERDTDETQVKKHLLKQEEGDETVIGKDFEGEIVKVNRVAPATLNQEFFDKAFGEGNVKSETEAKNKIKEEIAAHYTTQQKAMTFRAIMDHLIENNELELPKEFLKRWLLSTNEKLTAEQVENDFHDFEMNLRWTLIKSNLAKANDIEVGSDDVKAHVQKKINSYMGQYGNMGMNTDTIVEQYLQNQEQVNKEYEEILAERVLDKVYEKVSLVTKDVTMEEFNAMVQAANAKVNGAQG